MPRRNKHARRKRNIKSNSSSISITNLEQAAVNGDLAAQNITPLDSPVSIHIHSKRKRLADADGISGKAAIDGLVHSGLLPDDSAIFVEEVTFSQEKSNKEETLITIYRRI